MNCLTEHQQIKQYAKFTIRLRNIAQGFSLVGFYVPFGFKDDSCWKATLKEFIQGSVQMS
jgi:hypothetical protein